MASKLGFRLFKPGTMFSDNYFAEKGPQKFCLTRIHATQRVSCYSPSSHWSKRLTGCIMTYHDQPQKTYTSQNYSKMMWKMLAILNWHVLFAGPLSGIIELKRSEVTLLDGPSLLLCWTLKLGGMSSDRDTYKRKYKLWKNHWCYPQTTTKRTRMPHSASLMPTKKSRSVWTLKSTISAARNGGSKEICPLDSNKEPLWHTEKIPTGISANGYARTVQAVVVAVVEAVTVVKSWEQVPLGCYTLNGIMGTVLVPVAVIFALGAILKTK